jgi:hypothetical protein
LKTIVNFYQNLFLRTKLMTFEIHHFYLSQKDKLCQES